MDKKEIIEALQRYWKENKAKGLLAQIMFKREIQGGSLSVHKRKFIDGCWIIAPRRDDFYKFRFCFFTHKTLIKTELHEIVEPEELTGEMEGLKFRMVAGFLRKAGMSILYAVPICPDTKDEVNWNRINWQIYQYDSRTERLKLNKHLFNKWESRGRPSSGGKWSNTIKKEYEKLTEEELVALLLNEIFYSDFLKDKLHLSISDPYDVDAFLLSYSNRAVIPLEIKEKFPAVSSGSRFFGIDAGRVLMLLRVCLPNDSNALYVVREIEEGSRSFISWKFVPLSLIITSASWNLQRGGVGMGGQETQTVRIPYNVFQELNGEKLSENYLEKITNLPNDIKRLADEFMRQLEQVFGND